MSAKVQAFIYVLLRDELPSGVIERVIRMSEACEDADFSNPGIAQYASECAARLTDG